MRKYPREIYLAELERVAENQRQLPDGTWAPARPWGYPSLKNRIRCAWKVLIGKADALIWPEDTDG